MTTAALLGRHQELQLIRLRATQAASGVGQVVVIDGEVGIGKTTLLRAAAVEAQARGLRVQVARGEELQRLVQSSTPGTPGQLLAAAAPHPNRAGEWSTSLHRPGPLALLLDDAQEAEAADLAALMSLAESVHRMPVLLMVAHRSLGADKDADRLLQALRRPATTWLPLSPLSEAGVREMVAERLGLAPGPAILRMVADAAGNPLFITEIIEAAIHEDLLDIGSGVAESRALSAPPSLDKTLLQHLDFLPRSVMRLLQLASVMAPTGITVKDLAVLSSRSENEIATLISRSSAVGIITDASPQLAFRHPVLARAYYRSLPVPLRTALHLQIALALGEKSAAAERVVHHLVLAPPAAHPRLLAWYKEHIPAVLHQSPALAVTLLRNTLACLGSNHPDHELLRVYLAQALLRSAAPQQAQEEARQALAGLNNPGHEGPLRWVLACAHQLACRPDLAVREAEAAMGSHSLSPEQSVRFKALASVAMLSIDLERAETLAQETIETAQGLRIRPPTDAWYVLATSRYARWRPAEALALADRALDGASTNEGDELLRLQILRAYCLLQQGDAAEAERAVETGRQAAQHHGSPEQPHCELALALILFATGRWSEAIDLAQRHLVTGEHHPDTWVTAALRSLAAIICVRRGAAGDATAHMAHITAQTHISPCYAFLTLWARCLIDMTAGEPERALHRFFAESRSSFTGPVMLLAPRLVFLVTSLGHARLAQELTADLEARAAAMLSPELLAIATHCRALLTNAPETLDAAGQLYEQISWPLFKASHHEDMAAALAYRGHAAQARTRLYEALAIYDSMGASWDAVRATSRLRELGVRCGYRGRRGRPSSGWQSLTDMELTVAELVAQGLSNPDVAARLRISRRTVQTHVSSILSKLALTSRVEIAALVVRQKQGKNDTAPRP
ncbi:LuxR C-terminal-related transcriptional regulator [Streptomyces sp. NPDC008343]|uniref:LuxR C-terminal-related transcriptional regulator n=1 Tax=Streptomyces sp. NPDC008343 TaxID=3364828 RepID=UPI0036EF0FEA